MSGEFKTYREDGLVTCVECGAVYSPKLNKCPKCSWTDEDAEPDTESEEERRKFLT